MLTAEEKKWVRKLQKVLDECPSGRIGFYTIGDCDITLYDRTNEASFDLNQGQEFCHAVQENDAELGTLRFPNHVHSTSG